jgi:hypothetical protein
MMENSHFAKSATAITTALAFFLTGCSTSPVQYATSPSPGDDTATMIRLRECSVYLPENSPNAGATSYWNKDCRNGIAQGLGLAAWGTEANPVARYTGQVNNGTIHAPQNGGVFTDKRGIFKGRIDNGKFITGELSMPNGDKFEGSFDRGEFKYGVLRKANGNVIAGKFNGKNPVGEFYIRDNYGVWYGSIVNGQISKRKPLPSRPMTSGEMIGDAAVVLATGAVAVVMLYSGLILVGGAAALAAAGPAVAMGAASGGAAAVGGVIRVLVIVV